MKCQICNKNEANIVFTKIINNEKIILRICTDCAKKKGISVDFEKPSQPKVYSFIGSLTGVLGEKEDKEIPDLACDVCGLTFAEFKKNGLFGCDKCHVAFGEQISNLLKQIHGTDVYDGETPEKLSEEGKKIQHLKGLRAELECCIELEDYERAAELRDKIAEAEGKRINK